MAKNIAINVMQARAINSEMSVVAEFQKACRARGVAEAVVKTAVEKFHHNIAPLFVDEEVWTAISNHFNKLHSLVPVKFIEAADLGIVDQLIDSYMVVSKQPKGLKVAQIKKFITGKAAIKVKYFKLQEAEANAAIAALHRPSPEKAFHSHPSFKLPQDKVQRIETLLGVKVNNAADYFRFSKYADMVTA